MNETVTRSFEKRINEAITYAVKNNMPMDDISEILKRKIKGMYKDKVLFHGIHGTCSWKITNAGTLRIYPTNGEHGKLSNYDPATFNTAPWRKYADYVTRIVVEHGVSTYEDASLLFSRMYKCVDMDLRGLNTSNARDMSKMFYGCTDLVRLELGTFDVSHVENNTMMFHGCDKLENKEGFEARFLRNQKVWIPPKKKTEGDAIKDRGRSPKKAAPKTIDAQ